MSRPWYHPNPVRGGGPEAYYGAAHQLTEPWPEQKHNVRLVGHSDLNGWGDAFQIQVGKGICYVAASGVNGHDGMTILDVSDPRKPKIMNQLIDSPRGPHPQGAAHHRRGASDQQRVAPEAARQISRMRSAGCASSTRPIRSIRNSCVTSRRTASASTVRSTTASASCSTALASRTASRARSSSSTT